MILADVSHLLSQAAEQFLSKANNFEIYSKTAIDIINDITGDNFSNELQFNSDNAWLKSPTAWIIEYIVARKISAGSESYWAQTEKNYDVALKILASHRIKKIRNDAKAHIGKIANLYENE